MLPRLTAATAVLLAVTGCAGHTGGYDIDAICRQAKAPSDTVPQLNAIRDAIVAAAPKELGDRPAGKPFKKFKAGIALGTAAGNAAAPYAVPRRLQPVDLPPTPDTTAVKRAQRDLATACR